MNDQVVVAAPAIRLRSRKRKGKHRVYLLWIDEVFHGEFPSNRARRDYLDAVTTLEGSNHGVEET